jgi:hypothetical protein
VIGATNWYDKDEGKPELITGHYRPAFVREVCQKLKSAFFASQFINSATKP